MHGRSGIESLEARVFLAGTPSTTVPIRRIDGMDVATIDWQGKQLDMFAGRWMIALNGFSSTVPNAADTSRAARAVRETDDTFKVTQFIGGGVFLVEAPKQMQPAEVNARLAQVPGFRYLVPDFRYTTDAIPNDPFFNNEWGMNNTGQTGGVNDVDIDAPEAWNTLTGDGTVIVANGDTGVDMTHPDLINQIAVNPGEIANNGLDDDANGYVDDVRGYNFIFNNNNASDDADHGTHTGGTMAAQGNNGVGVAGVGWNLKLLPLKIGSGSRISGAAGVAAMFYVNNLKTRLTNTMNIRAVNHSWGGAGYDPSMDFAIGNASAAGIMVTAAAGNGGPDFIGDNNDITPHYPANYDQPNVISVANHMSNGNREGSSNYGPLTVDLAAPGTDVLSTIRQAAGSYAFFTGTSMAAPHVAGVVGVLFNAVPNATIAQIKNAILQSVDVSPVWQGITVSGGRLNLNRALGLIATPAQLPQPDLTSGSDTGISAADNITRDNTPTFQGVAQQGQTIKLYANGVLVGQTGVPPTNIYNVTANPAVADGTYNFTVTATNTNGEGPQSPPLQVTIDTVAPVPTGQFRYQNSPHRLNVAFGEAVGHSIGIDDFAVQNVTSSQPVNITGAYNNGNNTQEMTFPGNTILPDARFRLTVFASGTGGGITDVAGNALAADVTYNFLFMTGDANNDGRVNLDDFNVVAANFGQSPRDYGQGDFDYSGNVNLNDFNILAARFGQVLAGPAPDAVRGGTTGTRGGSALGDKDDSLGDLLA